jgi:pyrroline-5-carboxylate reductase
MKDIASLSSFHAPLLMIGAGKMGSALLASWSKAGLSPSRVAILEHNAESAETLRREGWSVSQQLAEIDLAPAIVFLAVKPQSLENILSALTERFGTEPMYLSIAAGKTLEFFARHLGVARVIRAMPNTPALIGEGISALCANPLANACDRDWADRLLRAAGETVWLQSERQMDAVTALSGSGPAYMFLMLEALVAAGVEHGLPADMAHRLAVCTMRGSAILAQKAGLAQKDESLASLRRQVTSPGGTTEAALALLMQEDGLMDLMRRAVAQAVQRAAELA